MMNIFVRNNNLVVKEKTINLDEIPQKNILWIDLVNPSNKDIDYISQTYSLDLPTKEEREEIEESARYWEDNQSITINTYFLLPSKDNEVANNETVTFIFYKKILFTIRYNKFKLFDDIQKSVLANPKYFEDGFDLISKIFEIRVERDADMLELVVQKSRELRKEVLDGDLKAYDKLLRKLSGLQEINMLVRDSLFDKRRAITAMLKSEKADMDIKKDMTIVLKDINSLVEFTSVNMNALDNLQSILTNQINLEQNKIIKLFTVVTVAMMPPTLIGTIYGMNFKTMPELEWSMGYPLSIGAMVLSTLIPIIYFKIKGWLG